MANTLQIGNYSSKHHRPKKNQKRKEKTRELKLNFLIVCEGQETEPNYFESFKSNVKSFIKKIDIKGEGKSTKSLVNSAIKFRDNSSLQYDSVWVVFDKDDFSPNNFNGAIQLAESNGIKAGWTNEAFELWYLLHFQFRNTGMSREDYRKSLEREINKKIASDSKSNKKNTFSYKKNGKDMYELLAKYGDEAQAIKFAEKLVKKQTGKNYADHNPCTKIHILVNELRGNSEEMKKLLNS